MNVAQVLLLLHGVGLIGSRAAKAILIIIVSVTSAETGSCLFAESSLCPQRLVYVTSPEISHGLRKCPLVTGSEQCRESYPCTPQVCIDDPTSSSAV